MTIYFLIYITFCIFYIVEDFIKSKWNKIIVYLSCLLGLTIFSGFRTSAASTDYATYLEFFTRVSAARSWASIENSGELFYNLIPFIVGKLGMPVVSTFFIFSIIGVFLKGFAIMRNTRYWFGALLVYFTYFYLLHEFTQIRAGIATGIWLLSISTITKRKFGVFLICSAISVCFHLSAIIYLLTYWIDDTKINTKKYVIALVSALIFASLKLDYFSLLLNFPIAIVAAKADLYVGGISTGLFSNTVNIFNVIVLVELGLLLILTVYRKKLQHTVKHYNFYLKSYYLSLILFFGLSAFPPVAFRVRELFQVVHIILIPTIIYLFKEKYVAKILVISIALIFLFIQTFYSGLVKPYF